MKRTIILKDPEPSPAAMKAGWIFRGVISLILALAADGLQWLFPPAWVLCDGAMVVALLFLWGWRWEIIVAVIPEVVPGFDLFPTWTLFVGYLVAMHREKKPAKKE